MGSKAKYFAMVGADENTLRRRKKRSVPVEALPVGAVPVEARAGDHWELEELMAADEHEVETAPGTPKAVEIEPLEISPVKCKQIANSFVHHTERAKQERGVAHLGYQRGMFHHSRSSSVQLPCVGLGHQDS